VRQAAANAAWNRIQLANRGVKLVVGEEIVAARIARTLRTLHSTAAVVYRHHRKPT